MNNKKIIVDIDQTGNVSIEGENFQGPECDTFIKEIGKEIGEIKSSAKKKDYNIKTVTKQKERN
jgi:hypothetical protein